MPGRPQVTDVTDSAITITWEPPVTDGGAPVLHYVVERREVRGPRWVRMQQATVRAPPYTLTNVLEGNQYEFRVSAENVIGVSEPSEMSQSVVALPSGGKRN